jgi:hypothetical protein
MHLIKALKRHIHNARYAKDPKKVFPTQKYIIEPAFEIAGVQYYRHADVFNIPCERGLMALAIYEEARMRCSREYLEKHVEVVRELLRAKSIDIYKINQLNEQMAERLNLVLDTDLMYKLASIVYFDGKENPAIYEMDYCAKKIDFWKQHKGTADFFLQKPLKELVPYLESVDFDLNEYSKVQMELNKIHSDRLSASISKKS